MSPLCDQWESEKVSCCCWTNIWFGSCLLHSGSVANCRRETGDVNTALVSPRIQTISVCESIQNILFKHLKYVFRSLVLCIVHDERFCSVYSMSQMLSIAQYRSIYASVMLCTLTPHSPRSAQSSNVPIQSMTPL